MITRLLIVIAMVGFVLFTIPQSSALSCAVPNFAESYDRHDLLLHGKLVEKELLFPESENQKTTDLTFDTIKVYKGDFSKTFTVRANLSWDDYYREGVEYVLFADKDENGYLRELCVGDYVSTPSIIKFLDEFLLDSSIADDVLSLYDVVRGFERDDLDIRINQYSSLNRGEIPVPKKIDPYQDDEKMRMASEKVYEIEETMGGGSGTAVFDEYDLQSPIIIIGIVLGAACFVGLMIFLRKNEN